VRPFAINGELWGVARVPAGDPRLIDRTDSPRLAVTDAADRMVYVRSDLMPPLLDRVMLHEVAHAITVSWGLLPQVRSDALRGDIIGVEEWAAQLVENHAMEAVQAARRALGRPICVRGLCSD
jgi:hypothetical protein